MRKLNQRLEVVDVRVAIELKIFTKCVTRVRGLVIRSCYEAVVSHNQSGALLQLLRARSVRGSGFELWGLQHSCRTAAQLCEVSECSGRYVCMQ